MLREYGDIDAAIGELRIARRLAHRAGSASREADVLATLGVALIFAGRSVSGRNALDAAVRQSTGHLRDRMLFRRGCGSAAPRPPSRGAGGSEHRQSRRMRAADDQVWEARALQERAVSYLVIRFSAPRYRRPPASRGPVRPRTARSWKQAKPP